MTERSEANFQERASEKSVFDWLCKTYVQQSDQRQKAMGLQYTDAETHDLAAAFFKNFVQPLQAQIDLLEQEKAE